MKSAAAQLPPLDPNLAPHVADADTERRVRILRKIMADESSPSMRRMAQAELRGIAYQIGWDRVEKIA